MWAPLEATGGPKDDEQSVLKSARRVVEMAKDVFVDRDGVKATAVAVEEALLNGGYSVADWSKHPLHPTLSSSPTPEEIEKGLRWVLTVDTLNFCFWPALNGVKWTVEWQGQHYTGYWALVAAVNRSAARHEGRIDITDPSVAENVTLNDLKAVFESVDGQEVPLLNKRLEGLHEYGRFINGSWNGSVTSVVSSAGQSAQKLMTIVLESMPSFRDEVRLPLPGQPSGTEVLFKVHKRIQILAADIRGILAGKGIGDWNDMSTITMFADYRVPQMLVAFGALKYSDALLETLNGPGDQSGSTISSGSWIELEIRAGSIWAVECVRQELVHRLESALVTAGNEGNVDKVESLRSALSRANGVIIDFYLWDSAKKPDIAARIAHIPIHKTWTNFY